MTLGEKSIHIALHLDTQADVTVIMDENFESLKSTRTPQPINDTGKCILSATDVDFFGNSTSVVVVDPLQSNVKAILDFPEPKNMKELASFLGTTNFYLNVALQAPLSSSGPRHRPVRLWKWQKSSPVQLRSPEHF